jgi:hypothetical protein
VQKIKNAEKNGNQEKQDLTDNFICLSVCYLLYLNIISRNIKQKCVEKKETEKKIQDFTYTYISIV